MSASELWCSDEIEATEVPKLVYEMNKDILMDSGLNHVSELFPGAASELWCPDKKSPRRCGLEEETKEKAQQQRRRWSLFAAFRNTSRSDPMSASELWCGDEGERTDSLNPVHTTSITSLSCSQMDSRLNQYSELFPGAASELWCPDEKSPRTNYIEEIERGFGSVSALPANKPAYKPPTSMKRSSKKGFVSISEAANTAKKQLRLQAEIEARLQEEANAIVERERLIHQLELEVLKQQGEEAHAEIELNKRRLSQAKHRAKQYAEYARQIDRELKAVQQQEAEDDAYALSESYFS